MFIGKQQSEVKNIIPDLAPFTNSEYTMAS